MNEAVIDIPVAQDETPSDRVHLHLLDRLERTRTCMLITHDESGAMHVRPMTMQQVEPPGILWMFTSARGRIAAEVAANPSVLVTFADVGHGAFAAVRGHADTLRDDTKQRELWTPLAAAWFTGGVDDPDLVLLRITMSWAEQWEPTSGKVAQALEIAAAALTKSVPDTEGVYRRLDFCAGRAGPVTAARTSPSTAPTAAR